MVLQTAKPRKRIFISEYIADNNTQLRTLFPATPGLAIIGKSGVRGIAVVADGSTGEHYFTTGPIPLKRLAHVTSPVPLGPDVALDVSLSIRGVTSGPLWIYVLGKAGKAIQTICLKAGPCHHMHMGRAASVFSSSLKPADNGGWVSNTTFIFKEANGPVRIRVQMVSPKTGSSMFQAGATHGFVLEKASISVHNLLPKIRPSGGNY
jgi:hypothetical protein